MVGALRGWADGELDGQRDGAVSGAEASAYVARALRTAGIRGQQPVWAGPGDFVLMDGASEPSPTFGTP